MGRGIAVALLGALPKNAMSRGAGWLAARRLPRALRNPGLQLFARAVGANLAEVRDPLDSFESIQAFFTRALVDGARPVDDAPDAFVSPCDGAWGEAGIVRDGMLLQIKGRPYSLAALLGDAGLAKSFEGGAFATLYLAPRDYHRFHAPCAARVLGVTHIPGALWPVNRWGVEGVDGLFAENERIVTRMRLASTDARPDAGDPNLCLVPVGATMVGKIRLCFDDLSSNLSGVDAPRHRVLPEPGLALAKGEEWGRFEFGSTIVLVAAPGKLDLEARPPGTSVRLGTRIGRLLG
jgi:phosphatidylserine decarboxylase